MGDQKDKKNNPLDTENVQYHRDEEFGTTVLHPDDTSKKKLSMKEVLKKMDENNRGMA